MNKLRSLLRKPASILIGLVVVFFLWLAFRPELLFVNKHVDDPFPATHATSLRSVVPAVRVA